MNGEFREGWDKHCKDFGIQTEPGNEVEAAIRKTNEYWADILIGLRPRGDNHPVMELARIAQTIDIELNRLER